MKAKITAEGQPCRHCKTPVIRRSHGEGFKFNPEKQAHWFAWWFVCPNKSCKALYHTEEAKRFTDAPFEVVPRVKPEPIQHQRPPERKPNPDYKTNISFSKHGKVRIECRNCKQHLPIKKFDRHGRNGSLKTWCNRCCAKYPKQELKRRQERGASTTSKLAVRLQRIAVRQAASRSAAGAKRRTAELNATPSWVDLGAIAEIYRQCQEISLKTGIVHHVDHIVPLKGKNVCGLHVPWNLQILTATENIRKSNKFKAA